MKHSVTIPQCIPYDDVHFQMQPGHKTFVISPALSGGEKAIVTLSPEDSWLYPDVVNSAVTLENFVGAVTKYVISKAPCRVILTAPPAARSDPAAAPDAEAPEADGVTDTV